MPSAEVPNNDPRAIVFRAPRGFLEAHIRIDTDDMERMTPAQRESMTVTVEMFTAALFLAVDQKGLQISGGTTSDVLRHLRYRIGQVPSSIVDGSIIQDPEQTSPSPATAVRTYSREITAASINFQQGIEVAQQRVVLYARSAQAIAAIVDQLRTSPKSKRIARTIEGLTAGMFKLLHRAEGMDEAISFIRGRPTTVPRDVQELTNHFGQNTE